MSDEWIKASYVNAVACISRLYPFHTCAVQAAIFCSYIAYKVAQKFGTLFVRLITSSNTDQFSINKNKTSVTTNFKKLTTGNNVFIVSVIIQK